MASPSAAAALTLHSLGGASARPRFAAVGADSAPKDDADDRTRLSDGEYRTVLAAQRTLLAFLRTALAVLVVFRDSAFGPVLASTVAAVANWKMPIAATAAPRRYHRSGPKRLKPPKKTTHGLLSPRRHRRDATEDQQTPWAVPRRWARS